LPHENVRGDYTSRNHFDIFVKAQHDNKVVWFGWFDMVEGLVLKITLSCSSINLFTKT